MVAHGVFGGDGIVCAQTGQDLRVLLDQQIEGDTSGKLK